MLVTLTHSLWKPPSCHGTVKHGASDQRLRWTVYTLILNSGSLGRIYHDICFIFFLWWISGSPSCLLSIGRLWILLPECFLGISESPEPTQISPTYFSFSNRETPARQWLVVFHYHRPLNPRTASTECDRQYSWQQYFFRNDESRMCRGLLREKKIKPMCLNNLLSLFKSKMIGGP